MRSEQLHTRIVRYPPQEENRALRCVSVRDFDNLEPLDFREILTGDKAESEIIKVANGVTNYVLEQRAKTVGEPLPLENVEDISRFLGGLAIRPFGKLSFVRSLEPPGSLELSDKPISSPGGNEQSP